MRIMNLVPQSFMGFRSWIQSSFNFSQRYRIAQISGLFMLVRFRFANAIFGTLLWSYYICPEVYSSVRKELPMEALNRDSGKEDWSDSKEFRKSNVPREYKEKPEKTFKGE